MFRRKGTREDDDDDFTLDKDLNFTLNTEGDFSQHMTSLINEEEAQVPKPNKKRKKKRAMGEPEIAGENKEENKA